jgi:hypothetical protein
MAKVLTRLLMGMIFVFVTISSPLHAHAMTQGPASEAATRDMDMSAMDEDCAKAMAAAAQAAEEAKTHDGGHKGDCCDVGCKCPLSHCPATLPGLVADFSDLVSHGKAIIAAPEESILPDYLDDTLKRPPRA